MRDLETGNNNMQLWRSRNGNLHLSHSGRSHASCSCGGPISSQFFPPPIGSGFVQFLERVLVPSPQVAVHSDHSDQCVYPPFITRIIVRKKKFD